jgi:hypothetical protein
MTRTLISLTVLVCALAAARRALVRPLAESSPAFVALVSPDRAQSLGIAALSVEYGASGERFEYSRRAGLWRSDTAFGALVLEPSMDGLLSQLLGAVGEMRTSDPARRAAYGLDGAQLVRVSLFGPAVGAGGETAPLLRFDLGRSLAGIGGGRSWVRLGGDDRLFEIQFDPRARLRRDAPSGLPPLLDERLLAGECPQPGGGLSRVFLDRRTGESLQLSSELGAPGSLGRRWRATSGDARAPCLPYRMAAWQAFLYRAPFVATLDPKHARELGLQDPTATLTLFQVDAEPIVLQIGAADSSGQVTVLNEKTGSLCHVAPEVFDLLLPGIDQLCEPRMANPWEAWLR